MREEIRAAARRILSCSDEDAHFNTGKAILLFWPREERKD